MRFTINDENNFFKDKDKAYIEPPKKMPFLLKIAVYLAQKSVKKEVLIAKLLTWYPKAAVSSAVLESLVAHDDAEINKRILKIIRVQVSMLVACPFCIDMNAFEYEKFGLKLDEINAIADKNYTYHTFSEKERIILQYAEMATNTPVFISKEIVCSLKEHFSERGIVIIASTIAQVNYWSRLIRALGVPVAGFGNICRLEEKG